MITMFIYLTLLLKWHWSGPFFHCVICSLHRNSCLFCKKNPSVNWKLENFCFVTERCFSFYLFRFLSTVVCLRKVRSQSTVLTSSLPSTRLWPLATGRTSTWRRSAPLPRWTLMRRRCSAPSERWGALFPSYSLGGVLERFCSWVCAVINVFSCKLELHWCHWMQQKL